MRSLVDTSFPTLRRGSLFLLLLACGRGDAPAGAARAPAGGPPAEAAPVGATTPAGAARRTVTFLGTSLTAALGLDPGLGYPAVLQEKIDSAGLPFEAVNAGVSGETSAGALRRLDWVLRDPPDVLVIETGANDGLRGLDTDTLAGNIQAMIDRARARRADIRLVLVGMEAPPNMGERYARRFRAVYPELARRNGIPLVPFLLDGVAGIDSLNQADGIHPTAAGQRRVAANVWPVLVPVLRAAAAPAS